MTVDKSTIDVQPDHDSPMSAEELLKIAYSHCKVTPPTQEEEKALLNQLPGSTPAERLFHHVLYKMADYIHDNFPMYEGVLGWFKIKERSTLKNWYMYYAEDLDDYFAINNLYHIIKEEGAKEVQPYFYFFMLNLVRI
jgi:hypothetical protein